MKYGYSLIGMSPRDYPRIAIAAQAAGFESLWLPEHLLFPAEMPPDYPYSESGLPITPATTPLYDPWIVLAALASVTSTIRLATNVFILPLRHPLMIARQLVTLDRVSGGRVILGAGVGWLRNEFDAVGVDFTKRGAMTDESIPLLRRLWSEPVIEHHGEFYDFDAIAFEPKPVQKIGGVRNIPIELGGASPGALRRAGRMCDGWIEIGSQSLGEMQAPLATIRWHREEAGRIALPFEITIQAGLIKSAGEIEEARNLGVTRLIATPPFDFARGGVKMNDALTFIERMGRDTIRAAA